MVSPELFFSNFQNLLLKFRLQSFSLVPSALALVYLHWEAQQHLAWTTALCYAEEKPLAPMRSSESSRSLPPAPLRWNVLKKSCTKVVSRWRGLPSVVQ